MVEIRQRRAVPSVPLLGFNYGHELRYISRESWFSKMLVDYEVNGKPEHHEGHGSESLILLPDNATNIEVKFQVKRLGIWSDVKEYDHFNKSWIWPVRPHIFRYNRPASCTYILNGTLFYEIVKEIPRNYLGTRGILQYFSAQSWLSKMLVDYEEDGKEKHREGEGSGSSILIPNNATKIKVKFQVMRFPGVWSDVKKYDRFTRCWVEPTQPHIFMYDTPVSCTYTLSGNLFWEKAISINDDEYERIKKKSSQTHTNPMGGYETGSYEMGSYENWTEKGDSTTYNFEATHGLQYISKEGWCFKMLVEFEENGETRHHEVEDSESAFPLPNNATNIQVSFQVMRTSGVWRDVKEYDHFKNDWVRPIKPHIFKYDTPKSCTYILTGNKYSERVRDIMGYDDENRSEKGDGAKHKLMYIFEEGIWFSKMLVDYKVNDEEKHREAHGSGSSILLRNNATNIKVRFQVERGPGVWSDVSTMKYDHSKKCWVKPTRPCIFEYNRPVSRMYTFCNVMKMTEDGSIIRGDLIHYNGCSLIHVRVGFQGIPSVQAPKNGQATKSSSAMNISTQESTPKVPGEIASVVPFNGANNEWFEENVFDENCDIKEVYVNELRSERFSWIKDFHIGIDEEKKSWQMSITHARNTEPRMKNLKKLFGDNIASFVDFIRESDDEDEERLRTSSCFLRAPSSGNTLYVQNEERGTIAVLAAQVRSNKKHYAITSYHVCYRFDDLPENIFEAHNRLKEDCCSDDAAGCIGCMYQYMDQETLGVLGVFDCGLYDNCNDIALIQLTPELTCVDAIAVLVNEVESQLLSKKQVWEIFKTYMRMGKLPKVKKYGSESDETEGELFAITTMCLQNNMNSGFYKIRGKNADDFAKKGDSGSLVCIAHGSKNLPFAMVSNHVPNGNVYYCPNLHQSIEALNKKYSWINIKPCIRQCGRF